MILVEHLYPPQLWDVRTCVNLLQFAKEMVEILQQPQDIKDLSGAKTLNVVIGEIAFRDVTFGFNQTRDVLQNINLIIKGREKIALIGPSGSGKSTFTRLLLRSTIYQIITAR